MFERFNREREQQARDGCPCFALFVGLLLWATRNCDTEPGRAKPR